MNDRVPLTSELVEALCARVDASSLAEHDRTIIKACMRDYLLLGHAFVEKSHSIHKLLRMIFGRKTEKASKVIPDLCRKPKSEKPRPRGHGNVLRVREAPVQPLRECVYFRAARYGGC